MRITFNKHWFVAVLLLGMALILVCEPFSITSGMSFGTYAIFLGTFGALCLCAIEYYQNGTKIEFLVFVFLLLLSAVAFLFAGEFSFGKVVPLICFLEVPILIESYSYSSRKMKQGIFWAFYALSWYYLAVALSPVAYNLEGDYGITKISELTLGLPNPNQAGIYLTVVFLVLMIAFFSMSKFRFLFLVNAGIVFILIFLTKSRTAIILCALLSIIAAFRFRYVVANWMKKFVWIVPILMFVFLMTAEEIYSSIVIMEDAFDTGRVEVYTGALETLNIENIWFGNYLEYSQQNLHNIFVSVLVEYGVIVATLYFLYMYVKTRGVLLNFDLNGQCVGLLSFCFVVIYSSMEAALFINGSAYAMLVFLVFYLSVPEEPDYDLEVQE